ARGFGQNPIRSGSGRGVLRNPYAPRGQFRFRRSGFRGRPLAGGVGPVTCSVPRLAWAGADSPRILARPSAGKWGQNHQTAAEFTRALAQAISSAVRSRSSASQPWMRALLNRRSGMVRYPLRIVGLENWGDLGMIRNAGVGGQGCRT